MGHIRIREGETVVRPSVDESLRVYSLSVCISDSCDY